MYLNLTKEYINITFTGILKYYNTYITPLKNEFFF